MVGDGHGDEDALALAAGELVRVISVARRRIGESDRLHGVENFLPDLASRKPALVDADRFGDLFADGHDRIKRRHRLLKDHGDVAAAELAHGFGIEGEKIASVELDAPIDGGCGIEQAQNSESGDGFSGTGFSDETEGFAFGNIERQAPDGRRGAEMDGEIIDAEH
jgi:hypothetical protein